MGIIKYLLCIGMCAAIYSSAVAAEYFVALKDPTEKLKLPEGVTLVKELPRLQMYIVRSLMKPQIQNAKFAFFKSYKKTGKPNNTQPTASVSHVDTVDTESGFAGHWPWGVGSVRAPLVWMSGYTGRGVKVLILDSGVNKEHPALAGKIAAAKNYVPRQQLGPVPYPEYDSSGHGTHIAAIIAGNGHNGLFGVAPGAELYVAKLSVFMRQNLDNFIEALEWGLERNIQIANMSFEFTSDWSGIGEHIFSRLEELNVLAVVAAGNDRHDKKIYFPGNQKTALTVGAIDRHHKIADFSKYGPALDILAPGVDVVSASLSKGINRTPELLAMESGTSMAAPHAVGVAALLLEADPQIKVADLRALIKDSAQKGSTIHGEGWYGHIDAYSALTQLIYQ